MEQNSNNEVTKKIEETINLIQEIEEMIGGNK